MDILHAGKYALYIYPAYGVSAVVLIALLLESLLAARTARRKAEKDGRP